MSLRIDSDAPGALRAGYQNTGIANSQTLATALVLLHRKIATQPQPVAPTPPILNVQGVLGAYTGNGGATAVAGVYGELYTAARTYYGGPAQDINVVWGRGIILPGNPRGRVLALTGEAYHQDATADGMLIGLEATVWNQGVVTSNPFTDNMGLAKVNILLGQHGKTATAGIVFGGDGVDHNWVYGLYMRRAGALGGAFIRMDEPATGGLALDIRSAAAWNSTPVRLPNAKYLGFYDVNGVIRGVLTLSTAGHIYLGGATGAAGYLVLQAPAGNAILLRKADATVLAQVSEGGTDGAALLVRVNGTLQRVLVGAADSGGTGYRMLRIAN